MKGMSKEDHATYALEEDDLWKELKDSSEGSMESVVGKALGRKPSSVRIRCRLFKAGPDANPLWNRIENGMALHAAHRLFVNATNASKGSLSFKEALELELAEYDSLGEEVVSPNGGVFRRRPPRQTPSVPPPPPSVDEIPPPSTEPPPQSPSSPGSLPKSPWKKIRSAMDEILEGKLKGADKDVADEIRTAFKAEVQRMTIWLHSRVKAGADAAPMDVILSQGQSRKNVLDWCKTLKVQAPKPGLPVDEEELKRKYRAFARTTHPDRPSGNTEKMAIINDAYQGLISYNFSLKSDI